MLQDLKTLLSTAFVIFSTLYLEARVSGETQFSWFEPVMFLLACAYALVYFLHWKAQKAEDRSERLEVLRVEAWNALVSAQYARPPHWLFEDAVYRYKQLIAELPEEIQQSAPSFEGRKDFEAVRKFLAVAAARTEDQSSEVVR